MGTGESCGCGSGHSDDKMNKMDKEKDQTKTSGKEQTGSMNRDDGQESREGEKELGAEESDMSMTK
jgi:hypothetical protein